MSIGQDLKETFEDVGTEYSIIEGSGSGESSYLDWEPNSQVTKPFIREFFIEGTLPYDTSVAVGDVLRFETQGDDFLLMNKTPELFENAITSYACVLYKCNVSGEIQRPQVARDAQYHEEVSWQTVQATAYGLQTEALYGHDLETDEELALIGVENHEAYFPSRYGTQLHDRVLSSSGEYYRVETKKTRRYSGVDVVELGEDTR